MTDWKPTEADIEWTRNLVNSLNNNGAWAVPQTMTIFTFDKIAKTYFVQEPVADDPLLASFLDNDCETNERIKICLSYLAYTEVPDGPKKHDRKTETETEDKDAANEN